MESLTLFPIENTTRNKNNRLRMVNNRNNNVDHDFYPTPSSAVYQILKHEKFSGEIWEPACGDGAISSILSNSGYVVKSTDLIDRGYGQGGVDFLRSSYVSDNIMTNPPFKHGNKFIHQAVTHARNKVVFLLRLSYLTSKTRKKFFVNSPGIPFARLYVHSARVPFGPSTMMDFGWFVWDKDHVGLPTVKWI